MSIAMGESVPINERVLDFINYGCPNDRICLKVVPPHGEDGLSASESLFEQFHRERTSNGFLSSKNESNICSMEIWYEDEEVTFYFTVPNEEEENHYRRMLSGYFDGMSITEEMDSPDKFVTPSKSHYVASQELSLRKHYFEPIGMAVRGDSQSSDNDPYQSILNEVDTKDINTRVVIQVMYKPALENWNTVFRQDTEEYAQNIEEDGISNPKLFGLTNDSVSEKSSRSSGASEIRDRASEPAFLTDIRIAAFSDTQDEAKEQLDTIVSLFSTNFRSGTGQSFTERTNTTTPQTLARMIRRESDRLDGKPSGLKDWFKFNLRTNADTMVLSLPELVSVAHLPSSNDVNVDGLQWSDAPVKGTLPPNAKKFTPVTDEEKESSGKYAGTPRVHNKNLQD